MTHIKLYLGSMEVVTFWLAYVCIFLLQSYYFCSYIYMRISTHLARISWMHMSTHLACISWMRMSTHLARISWMHMSTHLARILWMGMSTHLVLWGIKWSPQFLRIASNQIVTHHYRSQRKGDSNWYFLVNGTSFVNTLAIFVNVSSFPTRIIPAATASSIIW